MQGGKPGVNQVFAILTNVSRPMDTIERIFQHKNMDSMKVNVKVNRHKYAYLLKYF
jgi:hypothetical protein